MLGVAYDAIDAARITTLNQERAGILVLVTGNQNTLSAAKDLEPFMLERHNMKCNKKYGDKDKN